MGESPKLDSRYLDLVELDSKKIRKAAFDETASKRDG